jgi:hypothetical protein
MKIAAISFFFAFLMSGGVFTSSMYDMSFMNYTICHAENETNEPSKTDKSMEGMDIEMETHEHLEVHVIEIIPHLFHGDRLICLKKHEH